MTIPKLLRCLPCGCDARRVSFRSWHWGRPIAWSTGRMVKRAFLQSRIMRLCRVARTRSIVVGRATSRRCVAYCAGNFQFIFTASFIRYAAGLLLRRRPLLGWSSLQIARYTPFSDNSCMIPVYVSISKGPLVVVPLSDCDSESAAPCSAVRPGGLFPCARANHVASRSFSAAADAANCSDFVSDLFSMRAADLCSLFLCWLLSLRTFWFRWANCSSREDMYSPAMLRIFAPCFTLRCCRSLSSLNIFPHHVHRWLSLSS